MNGHLDTDEMAAFKKCLSAAAKAKNSQGPYTSTAKEKAKAKKALAQLELDFDNNGAVSEKERAFGMAFDADKNGKLDLAERKKAAAEWARKRAMEKAMAAPNPMEKEKAKKAYAMNSPTAKEREKAKKALSSLDLDGNGVVSERE